MFRLYKTDDLGGTRRTLFGRVAIPIRNMIGWMVDTPIIGALLKLLFFPVQLVLIPLEFFFRHFLAVSGFLLVWTMPIWAIWLIDNSTNYRSEPENPLLWLLFGSGAAVLIWLYELSVAGRDYVISDDLDQTILMQWTLMPCIVIGGPLAFFCSPAGAIGTIMLLTGEFDNTMSIMTLCWLPFAYLWFRTIALASDN